MKIKDVILFLIGGALYVLVELLYRGHSHISMFFIGGLCFFIVGLLNEHILSWDMSLLSQMVISAIVITFIEFESGAILNVCLGLNIWDYSKQPYNLLGQVCPLYSFFWFLLSLPAILLDDLLRDKWFGDTRKDYKIL